MAQDLHIGVLGGGAWGTALAEVACRPGQRVTLWCLEVDVADAINTRRQNTVFLPGAKLKAGIHATNRLSDLAGCDAILSVAPAQHTRSCLKDLKPHIRKGTPVILCAKGIELSTRRFMTEVLRDVLPEAVPAVLSGPSFASEVVRGLPTAITLAAPDAATGHRLMSMLASPTFRPYFSEDLLGAEIGGAVKNVLAIACGIVIGKGLGRSGHASLITRGFAEMTALAVALGAKAETLTGLSGLGDLVLTCSSDQSRNMSCGIALGQGESLEAILTSRHAVTEGVATAPVLRELSRAHSVDMPISSAVAAIIQGEVGVDDAIMGLLSRPVRAERM